MRKKGRELIQEMEVCVNDLKLNYNMLNFN